MSEYARAYLNITPPLNIVTKEMDNFVRWFNETAPGKEGALTPLMRTGLAHLYSAYALFQNI